MTTQARAALQRDIRAALAQMRQDIPPLQYWTATADKAAMDKCAEAIEAAAETYAEALAQPTLFDIGEAS